jgi:hypothetical protein
MRLADDPDARRCDNCAAETSFHLRFDFGLGAADNQSTIAGVFHPREPETWVDRDGSKVTFYPFLVVLNRKNRERAIWLPYWHVVERKSARPLEKYGQWAPFMDAHLFDDMLAQARAAGLVA